MDKAVVITEIMSHLSPLGEEKSGIQRFEVALALPNIVRELVTNIAQGTIPLVAQNNGLSGNSPDVSQLQEHLQKSFTVPVTGVGIANLVPFLSETIAEPLVLQYPFISVKHTAVTSKLSMYVPDEETIVDLGERYQDEAIVYTVFDKKILFAPDSLTGNLTVTGFYLPTIENLPLIFKQYIINMALSLFMGGKKK